MEHQPPNSAQTPAITTPPGIACLNCDTNLKTLPIEGNCPTCERPIRESTPGYSESWQLLDDRPCLKCGYSLLHQKLGGLCPECGTQVDGSILGTLLMYSSRSHLQALRRGVRYIIWSIPLGIVVFIVIFALNITRFGLNNEDQLLFSFIGYGSVATLMLVFVIGLLNVLHKEPAGITKETGSTLRIRIGWLCIFYVPVWIIEIIAQQFYMPTYDMDFDSTYLAISAGVSLLVNLLAVSIVYYLLKYFGMAAIRLSNRKLWILTKDTRRGILCLVVSYVLFTGLQIVVFATSESAATMVPDVAVMVIGLFSYVVLLVSGLYVFVSYIRILLNLNKSLRTQIRQLQSASNATPDPPRAHRPSGNSSGVEGPLP